MYDKYSTSIGYTWFKKQSPNNQRILESLLKDYKKANNRSGGSSYSMRMFAKYGSQIPRGILDKISAAVDARSKTIDFIKSIDPLLNKEFSTFSEEGPDHIFSTLVYDFYGTD